MKFTISVSSLKSSSTHRDGLPFLSKGDHKAAYALGGGAYLLIDRSLLYRRRIGMSPRHFSLKHLHAKKNTKLKTSKRPRAKPMFNHSSSLNETPGGEGAYSYGCKALIGELLVGGGV